MRYANHILLRRTTAMLLCILLCTGTGLTLAGAAFAVGPEMAEGEGGEAPPPVCVCETLCGDVPNELCPVCVTDKAGCTGRKPVDPVPACVCEVLCLDAPNTSCPVCAADVNGCTGAAPEPACICNVHCEDGRIDANCPVCLRDRTACTGREPDPIPPSGVDIRITPPDHWAVDTAAVEVCIADVTGGGFARVQVKIGENGQWRELDRLSRWENLSYGWVDISENCVVYTSVTGCDGRTFEASCYVECFDRAAPDLRAVVDGQLLWVEVHDGLSGVEAVFIDGAEYTGPASGTLDVPLRELGGEFEQFSIQAVDRAGNRSRVVLVDNPNYQPPEPPAAKEDVPPDSSEQPKEEKPEAGLFDFFQGILGAIPSTPTEPSTTTEPSDPVKPSAPTEADPRKDCDCDCDEKGPASAPAAAKPSAAAPSRPATQVSTAPATITPAVTAPQTAPPSSAQSTKPLTPDGQGTVVDNTNGETGKQFYTFRTPGENVFYLVVDNDRDSDNVYFLNAVTESDLAVLAEQDAAAEQPSESAVPVATPEPVCVCKEQCIPGEVDADCPVCVLSRSDCAGAARTGGEAAEPVKEPKGGAFTLLVAAVIVLAVGGAGYYVKKYKPKHELDDAEEFDELTGEEDTINEDDLGPVPRPGPFDEPEEPDYMDGGEG